MSGGPPATGCSWSAGGFGGITGGGCSIDCPPWYYAGPAFGHYCACIPYDGGGGIPPSLPPAPPAPPPGGGAGGGSGGGAGVVEECLSHLGTMMTTKTMMIPVMTMQIVLMETSDGPGPHIGRNQMHI